MLYTYKAANTAGFSAAAGSAMFFVISGSASATRRVKKIRVSGNSLTTLAVAATVVEKRSTAPTGGTATALTRVPVDSSFPAALTDGLVQTYTAAPTEGTLVGTIAIRRHIQKSDTVAEGAQYSDIEFLFDNLGDDGKVGIPLHGTAENLNLAFAADPASTVSVVVEVEWTEDTSGR